MVITIDKYYKNDIVDKISAIVTYPCKGLVLKHIVSLSTKGRDNKRGYYYNEYLYGSPKYTNYNELISSKLNFGYYLLLEVLKDEKESFLITNNNMYQLVNELSKMIRLLHKEDLYFKKGNNLVLNQDYSETKFKITSGNKVLIFKPTVIDIEDSDYEGFLLYFNKLDNVFYMTYENIYALYYLLKGLNLYQASLSILSYIGKPDNDYYLKRIDVSYNNQSFEETATSQGIGKREILSDDISSFEKSVMGISKRKRKKMNIYF